MRSILVGVAIIGMLFTVFKCSNLIYRETKNEEDILEQPEEISIIRFEDNLQVVLTNAYEVDTIHSYYIKRYAPLALNEQKRYGIPVSIKLAQMIHEGGFNERNPYGSQLVRQGNNPFGIKYFGDYRPYRVNQWDELAYTGTFVLAYDDCGNEQCRFIKFKGMWHAFRYHSILIAGTEMNPSHYKKHITQGDWQDWSNALQKGGYATSEDYNKRIEALILNYKLYLLDNYQI